MAEHNVTGQKGEQLAADIMTQKGYKILETNWKLGRMEIDIIAANKKEIVFVEVKTRTSMLGGTPEEAVDEAKKRRMVASANAYLKYHQEKRELRFDIIGILMNKSGEIEQISHFENAFTPNLKTINPSSYSGRWLWPHSNKKR